MTLDDAPLHRCLRVDAAPRGLDPYDLVGAVDAGADLALLEDPGAISSREAADEVAPLGRYSYLCLEPYWQVRVEGGRCWSGPPGATRPVEGRPLEVIAGLLARFGAGARVWEPGLPPLVSGAVGYLGYELLHEIEAIGARRARALGAQALADAQLTFFGLVVAADRREGAAWILSTGVGGAAAVAAAEAERRLALGRRLVARGGGAAVADAGERYRQRAATLRARAPRLDEAGVRARGITPTVERGAYLAAIAEVRGELLRGNAFEVCLSQRFDLTSSLDGLAIYDVLRAINPAPMSAYLRLAGLEVLSASPERFLALDRGRAVETRPIKGTRPRGRTPAEDEALRAGLVDSPKDRAENLMIVDLCRNDLGKVCDFGSVRVAELCGVRPYAFTWQMVSTIRGRLRDGLGPVDLVRAAFPGGSMTGAPKIEAMKIIDRLEPTERGVFSGAIGYFDLDGALDLSIVIRTLVKQGERITFHVGGAIVADSDPDEEYQETLDKAHGLVLALEVARAAVEGRGA